MNRRDMSRAPFRERVEALAARHGLLLTSETVGSGAMLAVRREGTPTHLLALRDIREASLTCSNVHGVVYTPHDVVARLRGLLQRTIG